MAKAAAPTVKRVAQELGGKSANIILDDADFAKAISRDVFGLVTNSGQSCNAPTRMLVPNARMDEAAAIAKAAAEQVKVGDPNAEDTTIGPVVSEVQFNKIKGLIQQGIDEGAKLETGGTGRPDGLNAGYYVKPTVFSHVTNDMTIGREEIFWTCLGHGRLRRRRRRGANCQRYPVRVEWLHFVRRPGARQENRATHPHR